MRLLDQPQARRFLLGLLYCVDVLVFFQLWTAWEGVQVSTSNGIDISMHFASPWSLAFTILSAGYLVSGIAVVGKVAMHKRATDPDARQIEIREKIAAIGRERVTADKRRVL